MAFNSIPSAWIAVGKKVKQSLWQYVKDNFDALNVGLSQISGDTIGNYSMELDADLDGIPDTWTRSLFTGGQGNRFPSVVLGTDGLAYTCILNHTAAAADKPITGANWATYWAQEGDVTDACAWASGSEYRATVSVHGKFGAFFVHPGGVGNGGGSLTSDYIPCTEYSRRLLGVIMSSSASGIKNLVDVKFYSRKKVYLSTTNLFTSTANPTSPILFIFGFTPPANARYFKIVLTGGDSAVNVAGTVYFDGLWLDKNPQWSFNQDFTIGSQSWNGAWSDRASATIAMPYAWGLPIYMEFTAQLKTDNGGTFVQQRFRIGSAYSNISPQTTALADVTYNYAIVYTPDVAGSATPKTVTIYMQLASNGAGTQAIGQKTAEVTASILHNVL